MVNLLLATLGSINLLCYAFDNDVGYLVIACYLFLTANINSLNEKINELEK